MATLSGQTIANTFDSILHVEDDTAGLVATATDSRVIQDGVGQSSALALATDSVRITSTNKLYFNDAGAEEIHSASDGHLEVNSGTTLDITAPTVDINASTAVTVDGPSVAISSTSASEPVLHITNTHAGATAGEIRFNKDSASGADNDVMGTISWYGTDDDDNTHERLAYMDAIITDSAEGSEAASLRFYVAENDATLTKGLEIAGQPDDNAEVDVTIGAGAASTTTTAGDLTVTGNLSVTGTDHVGITHASIWRLTTNTEGNHTPLASNLEEDDTYGNGTIGSSMTESSGIFTFPVTGYWLVTATHKGFNADGADDESTYVGMFLSVTTNGEAGSPTYSTAAAAFSYLPEMYTGAAASTSQKIIDVTSTTNVKVRFEVLCEDVDAWTEGSTEINTTHFTFIRLGDT